MVVARYFLLFIIYSFIGWSIEVIRTIIIDKKLINRGFLVGPYCPIYGCGAIMMILLLSKYMEHPITLFVMSIVIFSLLEYYTSYFMEKLFKARWWDYSKKKFNINGRICLETMIPFGLLGCTAMYIINPFLNNILLHLSSNVLIVLALIIFVVFVIDNIISFKIISGFKNVTITIAKDSTEEITKRVKQILYQKSIFTKRLIDSFPHLVAVVKKFKIK